MSTKRNVSQLKPIKVQWAELQSKLTLVLEDGGLRVGSIPDNDCFLVWDGSTTPIIVTTRFDKTIDLARKIEHLLAETESLWRLFVYDDQLGSDGKPRRYLISAVGSQFMP